MRANTDWHAVSVRSDEAGGGRGGGGGARASAAAAERARRAARRLLALHRLRRGLRHRSRVQVGSQIATAAAVIVACIEAAHARKKGASRLSLLLEPVSTLWLVPDLALPSRSIGMRRSTTSYDPQRSTSSMRFLKNRRSSAVLQRPRQLRARGGGIPGRALRRLRHLRRVPERGDFRQLQTQSLAWLCIVRQILCCEGSNGLGCCRCYVCRLGSYMPDLLSRGSTCRQTSLSSTVYPTAGMLAADLIDTRPVTDSLMHQYRADG